MGGCTIRVNGAVEVVDAAASAHAVTGRQPQAALAYLALADRAVDREELADLLWGDDALSDHWKGAVRGVLAKVRSALVAGGLPAEALSATDGQVRLRLPEGWSTDVDRADAALAAATRADRDGDPAHALDAARAAGEALGNGTFLVQLDGDWARLVRDRVEHIGREASAVEVRSLLALDRPAEAARVAEGAVARDVLDEVAHHQLVSALVAADRRVDARRAHERLARVLDEELGISPAEATTALVASTHAPAESAAVAAVERPARPRTGAGEVDFVGRRAELDVLTGLWAEVVAEGRPRIVVVEGPTGIGKTRLAAHLADHLAATGARTRWGRCRQGSGVPYEPVAEAFDADGSLFGAADPAPERRRGPLFRAVARTVAEETVLPTVWVVDDLQWASEDTVHLLEVVLDGLERPVLVVATCRSAPAPVLAGLARIQRLAPLTTLALDGFDEADLLAFVAPDGAEAPGDRERARALLDRTDGHPLLVTEMARDGRRRGVPIDSGRVPDSVRGWVGRRAGALEPALAARLDLAATIGLDVDLDLLARCSSDAIDVVLDQCEALVRDGLLVEAAPSRFAFPHLVIHQVVYGSMGPTRRALLHRRVAAALDQAPPRLGVSSERAHHHARSGPAARGHAARHGLDAGRESLVRSAWALAEGQLAAAAEHAADDPGLRAEVLVEQARARHGQWDHTGAATVLEEACALAREHARPDQLAEAVLLLVGRAGRGVSLDLPDVERIALLREAIAALGPDAADDPGLRSLLGRVEVELALVLLLTDADEERRAVARRPLARARAATRPDHDDLALALLGARLAKLHPAQAHERLADLDEILGLPDRAVAPELRVRAFKYRHEDRLVVGDRNGAREDLARGRALADHHGHPYWQWAGRTWEALGHLIDGDLERAEAEATAAAALQVGGGGETGACFGVNLVAIRCFQGRAAEVVDLVAGAVEAFPHVPCYRAVLALVCAEAGDGERAQEAVDHFAAAGFANLPDDTNRPLGLAVLANAAVRLGAVDAGAALAPLVEPFREQHILLNCYGGGGSYWGPAAHHLAGLAALAGRPDAVERYAEARRRAVELGAAVSLPRIDAEHATLVAAESG